MSLYLTIFDGPDEIAGWVFGHYSDFGYFRDKITEVAGSGKYPVLMNHSDCDGQWSLEEIAPLRNELRAIAEAFRKAPAQEIEGAFEHTSEYRQDAKTLYDCFHNVDGENVFEALLALCDEAERIKQPILFQ